jgi:hypothetical protein
MITAARTSGMAEAALRGGAASPVPDWTGSKDLRGPGIQLGDIEIPPDP